MQINRVKDGRERERERERERISKQAGMNLAEQVSFNKKYKGFLYKWMII